MKNLATAIIAVMKAVKGIEKSMTVGSGSNAYQGVSDKEVKKAFSEAMTENGLCILPLEVDAKTVVSRWEETTTYNSVPSTKSKQSVFTEVTTKYLLLHTSGESQVISGYGHGVDTQDKGAGKATTYALKNTLLYTFLTPTGTIDDADKDHSDDADVPPPKTIAPPKDNRPFMTEGQYKKLMSRITNGEQGVYESADKAFQMSDEYRSNMLDAVNGVNA